MVFPFLEEPYLMRVQDFKKAYTHAALRVVELSSPDELKALRVYPFALQEIQKTLPEKAPQVSRVPPEVDEFRREIAFWLELKLKEEPRGSAMWSHFKGVADYIATEYAK